MLYMSIVTPVYGNQLDLENLYRRLVATLTPITADFEIVMVNDQSPDNAWEVIQSLAKADPRVKGISLARNFGQHQAITAGIDAADGDWVVVMDCDLQDRPEEIPNLYAKAKEGYDIVVGRRSERKDGFITRATTRLFYVLFNYLTDQKLDSRVANFGIYSEKATNAIRAYSEKDRSFGLLAVLVGFRRAEIDVVHGERKVGKSGYNLRRRLTLAIDHVLSHSNKPLKMLIQLGLLLSFCSFAYSALLIARYVTDRGVPSGWTSVIVSILFSLGILTAAIGIVGLYVGKIYDQVKNRPLYIVDQTTFGQR